MSRRPERDQPEDAATRTQEVAALSGDRPSPHEAKTRLVTAIPWDAGSHEETRVVAIPPSPLPGQVDVTRLVEAPTPEGSRGAEATHLVEAPTAHVEGRGRFDWSQTAEIPADPTDHRGRSVPQEPEGFPLFGVVPRKRRGAWTWASMGGGRSWKGALPRGVLEKKRQARGSGPSWDVWRGRRWLFLGVGVAALGIAAIGLLLAGGGPRRGATQAAELPLAEVPPTLQLFEEGLEAFREGEYEVALEKFRLAEAGGGGEARRYADRVERELQTHAALDRVESCLAQGDLPCAEEAIARADPGTHTYRLRVGGAKGLLSSAQGMLGRAPDATTRTEDTDPVQPPSAPEPGVDSPGSAEPVLRVASSQGTGAAPKPGPRRKARAQAGTPAPGPRASPTTQVVVELVRQSEAEVGSRAIPLLEEAWSQVRGLAGAEALERQVRSRLAAASYDAATEAQRIGALLLVVRHLQRTLEADPGHGQAAAWLARLQEKAEDLFWEGYSLRERNPARAKERLELVRALTRPRDPLHRKATKWLQSLEGA